MNPENLVPQTEPAIISTAQSPATPPHRERIFAHPVAWIVLAIALLASAGGWVIAHQHAELAAQHRFTEEANRITASLTERFLIYQDVLHGAAGLYAASYSVEREEWKAYCDMVSVEKRFPGINGLGFAGFVPRTNLETFLDVTRKDKTPGFTLKNPGSGDDLIPIKYFEPEARHRPLLGLDLGTDRAVRAAAEAARDRGDSVMSSQIVLPGTGGTTPNGFLLMLPVYRRGTPQATLEERRANLEGWVFARCITSQLMEGILKNRGLALNVEVFESALTGHETLIFDGLPHERPARSNTSPRFSEVIPLDIAAGAWTLRFTSTPAFDAAAPKGTTTLVGWAGAVVSLLLFSIAWSLSATRQRALAIASEMTAALRKANESLEHERFLLQTLMDNLPDHIYFKDLQSRFLRNNQAHLHSFGLQEPAQALGKTDFDFFTEEHARQAFVDEQQLIRTGQPITLEEKETWRGGSVTWVLTTKMPLRDPQGRIVGTFGISRDITARKKAEEALRQAKEAAEQANRIKSQFLASMSHELRTPLNSVIGFANILLKNKAGTLGPTELNFLERIQANGKHLLGLINEILDLSKIEARKVELQLGPVDLGALVRETLAQQEGLVREHPVQLLAELPATLAPIQADAEKLRQVLINLVGNALKFTERGSVTVRVVAAPGETRPTRIDVIDTGIGIPSEKLGTIFEAFQQAEGGIARRYGGTGLGLTISQALCQLMGCQIKVASEVGRGSTFSILLGAAPVATELPPTVRQATPPAPAPAVEAPPEFAGKTALVIDDELDSRTLLTHLLEEFGCQVIAASSGEQGLRMAREFHPQVITVDLLMPGMNGWEVIRAVKADPQLHDLPIVVISVIAAENRGRILGAVDVLQKPVTREDVLAVLRRNLVPARPRVLVVDDEADARQILRDCLEGEAAEILEAANGREALELLARDTTDLVLLDLMMPEMDGLSFLSAIRADPRFQRLPVVVITAKELTRTETEQLRLETLEVLDKAAVFQDELKRVLRQVLKEKMETPREAAAKT